MSLEKYCESLAGNLSVGVVGLGYVGLPLALEASRIYEVIGFDNSKKRINQLNGGYDCTGEVDLNQMAECSLSFTSDVQDLSSCDLIVVAVPTPIDEYKVPDFLPLLDACDEIAPYLRRGSIVVFESTMYPGATQEILAPRIELKSNLILNVDFFVGYSPERINPGDKTKGISDIVKLTSGSTDEVARIVDDFYRSFIQAGTHLTNSIKVAESAKVIENIQRDVNIALVNELAVIFRRMDLNIHEILIAARTKWNFLDFRPGLVGGHCIGVDPYYLMHSAQKVGVEPTLIRSARIVNEGAVDYIFNRILTLIFHRVLSRDSIGQTKILLMGLTFKKNVKDLRNSKSLELYRLLTKAGLDVNIHDPLADPVEIFYRYETEMVSLGKKIYSAAIILVAHDQYRAKSLNDYLLLLHESGFIFDVNDILPSHDAVEKM